MHPLVVVNEFLPVSERHVLIVSVRTVSVRTVSVRTVSGGDGGGVAASLRARTSACVCSRTAEAQTGRLANQTSR